MEILEGEKITISSLLNRSDVQALLKALSDGSLTVLKPELSPNGEFTYPDAERIMGSSPRLVKEVLETFAEENILSEELSTVATVCPYCGDNRFTVELTCPHCGSTRLRMGVTIEHLECGYIGFEEEVRDMICPKCRKRMRALGIDFRKPGVLYRCLSCKEFVSEPRRKYTCLRENHVFYEDESVSRELHSYRLNPEKKDFVGRWVMDLTPVIEVLRAKGWRVEAPARIMGKSGVEHTFSLSAFQDDGNIGILTDILVNDRPIDDSALSLIFKALDVDASKRIMIFIPELTVKARALFDYYRVLPNTHLFECNSIDKVNNVILSVLDNIVELSPRIK
jgi:predicted RNA-binding Zn-ribbon protein involved in translation (DUF1610 family)